LKMMLGLGKPSGSDVKVETAPQEQPAEAPSTKKSEKASKANKQQRKASTAPAPAKAAASPAWGGGASAAPRKSIAEIQQEEARTAARMAMERQHNPRSSSGGWANVAASKGGSTGWQSGTVKPTSAAVVTNAAASTARTARPQATGSQRQAKSSSEKHTDDFGATMPPALENWCKIQMQKLNGSDDLTLVCIKRAVFSYVIEAQSSLFLYFTFGRSTGFFLHDAERCGRNQAIPDCLPWLYSASQ
jgi:hypothetical protein